MATERITSTLSNAVSGAIAGTVATAGSVAGGALSSVGNSINGVGASVESSIRQYGDSAKDYGNYIKDYTKAPGARVSTAKNPLGLKDSPAIDYRPKPSSKPAAKKAIEAPKPASTTTTKMVAAKTTTIKPVPSTTPKAPAIKPPAAKTPAVKPPPAKAPVVGGQKALTGLKPSGSSAEKKPVTAPGKDKPSSKGTGGGAKGKVSAANPLGL